MHRAIFFTLPLTTAFLLTAVNAFSQDWQPIHEDKLYFYQADTADHITHQLQVDSTRDRKGRDIYFLNVSMTTCDTCDAYDTLTKLTGDSTFYRVDEPFFWQRSMDYFRGAYYFYGNHDFKLELQKPIDSQWTFRTDSNNVTARIDSVYSTELFGTTDSVKRIRTSNGKTVKVSKNYGFLTFPGFKAGIQYQLKGVQGEASKGTTFGFRSIYDFEPGDVLHYLIEDESEGDNIYLGSNKQVRILNKTAKDTTLVYQVAMATLEKSRVSATDTLFTLRQDTVTWRFRLGKALPYEPRGFPAIYDRANVHPGEALGSATIRDQDPIPDQNDIFHLGCRLSTDRHNRLTKTIGGEQPFDDSTAKYLKQMSGDPQSLLYKFYQVKKYIGGYYKKQFKRGLGLTDFYLNFNKRESYRMELIGYVKQGDTTGTVYADLEAREGSTGREAVSKPEVHLYPNPVQQTLHLENLSLNQPAEVRIYNQMGQVVRRSTVRSPTAQLDMSPFNPGIYLIKLQGNDQVIRQKVIKR